MNIHHNITLYLLVLCITSSAVNASDPEQVDFFFETAQTEEDFKHFDRVWGFIASRAAHKMFPGLSLSKQFDKMNAEYYTNPRNEIGQHSKCAIKISNRETCIGFLLFEAQDDKQTNIRLKQDLQLPKNLKKPVLEGVIPELRKKYPHIEKVIDGESQEIECMTTIIKRHKNN